MAKAAEGTATTSEQNAGYLAALEREKVGYEARLKALDSGAEDRLTPERLKGRIDEVVAEIKRVKPAAKKPE